MIDLLYIRSYMEGNFDDLRLKLMIDTIVLICVVVAVLVDLFLGIRKAKQRDEYLRSFALRRTVTKCTQYLCFVVLGILIDVIGTVCLFDELYFVCVFGIACVGCEVVSWWEKADAKQRKRINKARKLMTTDKEKILKAFSEILEEEENETK